MTDNYFATPREGEESPRRPGKRYSERGKYSLGRSLAEWLAIIAIALLATVVVRGALIQAFWIPSESMVDTLQVGDRVFVNKLSYKFGEPKRGDIIVFHIPPDAAGGDPEIKDLIKRVIGLPGERIELRQGKVFINGTLLKEPYVDRSQQTTPQRLLDQPLVVPEGTVFVMGDNRENSSDGRTFGPIDESLIIGRAFVKIWPLSDFELL